MDWGIIATGIAIGIAVAAPIGPINLMCIQRTLQFGFLSGLATGMGAVLGDGAFAIVSAFGLSWIADLVSGYSVWLQGLGGIALCFMGLVTMRSQAEVLAPAMDRVWVHNGGLVATTFLLTVSNPATMFGFVAIFSGIGGLVATEDSFANAAQLVGAVMTGSFIWWLFLARIASLFRQRISNDGLKVVNRVAGLVILAFGLAVLVDLFV